MHAAVALPHNASAAVIARQSARVIAAATRMRRAARLAYAESRAAYWAVQTCACDPILIRVAIAKALQAQNRAIAEERRLRFAEADLADAWRGRQ